MQIFAGEVLGRGIDTDARIRSPIKSVSRGEVLRVLRFVAQVKSALQCGVEVFPFFLESRHELNELRVRSDMPPIRIGVE